MALTIELGILLAILALYYLLYRRVFSTKISLPLPPGPVPKPVVGNALQIPVNYQQFWFTEWSHRYGDLIYLRVFNQPLLVLNSVRAAFDLLDKRSAIYSDRPHAMVLEDLMGWDALASTMRYGPMWRVHRRWFHSSFLAKQVSQDYRSLQTRAAHRLLHSFLRSPDAYMEHVKKFSADLIMEIGYGHLPDDHFTHLVEELMAATVDAGAFSSTLFDLFPFLLYIPDWMPGATFKRRFTRIREVVRELHERSPGLIMDTEPSFLGTLLNETSKSGSQKDEMEYQAEGAAIALYAATIDTTLSVLTAFILTMILYPEVLKKAQAEIDEVVGKEPLPDFSDRESLPYLECVIQEIYRWNPPLPLGLAHRLVSDDQYRGYHIPGGTVVAPNIWAMSRNSQLYPDPEVFFPERFLGMDKETRETTDLRRLIFGFGRRICPGRHLADANVWIVAATVIATFSISKTRDSNGQEVTPPSLMRPGLISHWDPFPCDIRPRSDEAARLVLQITQDKD